MNPKLHERNPSKLRLVLIALLGLLLAVLLNLFVWDNSAKADEPPVPLPDHCYDDWTTSFDLNCTVVGHEINYGPDLRQAVGNTATGCIAGLIFGGPVGCYAGASGGFLGAIPWDGTWDSAWN